MSSAGSTVVREVISSTASGADVMSALPGLVRRLLDEEAWREFTVSGLDEPVRHETFMSFVQSDPPRGLGGRRSQLIALCGTDDDLAKRVRDLTEPPLMTHDTSTDRDYDSGRFEPRSDNITTERGTSESYRRRRLRRDQPELLERVESGELSLNEAAIEAGFGRRYQSVRIDDPERAARTLRKHMSPDAMTILIKLLQGGKQAE